jgi:hypothetical protein
MTAAAATTTTTSAAATTTATTTTTPTTTTTIMTACINTNHFVALSRQEKSVDKDLARFILLSAEHHEQLVRVCMRWGGSGGRACMRTSEHVYGHRRCQCRLSRRRSGRRRRHRHRRVLRLLLLVVVIFV